MRVVNRRGFSLVETIVSVGIVAAMAAVVVPQVVKQFDSSDQTSAQQDLKGLQSAIETFTVNMRGAYPGDLDDLANPLDVTGTLVGANTDTSITSTGTIALYSTDTYWNGPYVDFAVAATGATTKTSGYGSIIQHVFVCYIADGTGINTFGSPTGNQSCTGTDATSRMFLAVRITGLGNEGDGAFESVNALFDGSSEGANSGDAGRIRNVAGVTFFLATPLN